VRRQNEQQEIAVKVLNPIWIEDSECRRLFESEANRLKELRLPGVVQIFGSHLNSSPPLFEMEWIDGLSLDVSLEEDSPERIAACFADVCRILSAAHDAGIVHGDLKPANVMIRNDGSPVLLDFGLSTRLSDEDSSSFSSSVAGTPAYLAPERIRDRTRAASGDIYSLGVTLYRVLAGRVPFERPTVFEQLQCHLHQEPTLPSAYRAEVSDGLQRICLKAMEKNPSDRYQSTAEMAADLDRVVAGEVIRTRPTAYDNLLFHPVRQHLDQVRTWCEQGLLSTEEENRLRAAYDLLTQRGMPAVMESRQLRFWQLLSYLGGWAIVNGAAIWLILHWNDITPRVLRIGLGTLPVLCMLGTALWMWRKQRYPITFAALVTLIVATPVFSFVWLYEFELAATVTADQLEHELFGHEFDIDPEVQPIVNFSASRPIPLLTNEQVALVATSMLIVATSVMLLTGTRTHSAQAGFAHLVCYTALLLIIPYGNLVRLAHEEQWASIAARFLPSIVGMFFVCRWLIRTPGREPQAVPWLYLLATTLIIVTITICEFGPQEWFEPETITHGSIEPWTALSHLTTILGGLFLVGTGFAGRRLFLHRGRLATFGLMLTGLVCIPLFAILLGTEGVYPDHWPRMNFLDVTIPLPHLLLPLIGVAIALAACRTQMLLFLVSGLATLAFSLFFLGTTYFQDTQTWPVLVLVTGLSCFLISLVVELARSGSSTEERVSGRRF
jgi:hypothetical protein